MNVRTLIYMLASGLFMLVSNGCQKSSPPGVNMALVSTGAVFRPNLQEPIPLSPRQVARVKRIVARFNVPSQVRMEKEILPYESGGFVLGGVHFGWLGRILYVWDPESKRYYVVEDSVLAHMSEVFFKAQGEKPPFHYPSREQWKEILAVLDPDGNQ
jgi:hypothetical protein